MEDKEKDVIPELNVDDEEYKKALEAVTGPKKSKKKATTEEKAEGSASEDKSDEQAREEGSEDTVSEENKEETASEEKTVSDKPKKKKKKVEEPPVKKFDPVIPLCLVLAVLAIVGAVLYFTLPKMLKKNLGMTIDELRVNYEQTYEYTTIMANYGFNIPTNVTVTPAGESNVDRFEVVIPNNAVPYYTCLMGSQRSADGKIVQLRVMANYSNSDEYFDFLMIYFASYLHVFYPELDQDAIRSMVTASLSNIGTQETDYVVNGNYGYRTIYETRDMGTFVIFEIENAGNLLPAEIASAT